MSTTRARKRVKEMKMVVTPLTSLLPQSSIVGLGLQIVTTVFLLKLTNNVYTIVQD